MTDEPATNVEDQAAEPDGGQEHEPAWYRETIDRKEAENVKLRDRLERLGFEKVGLNPDKGLAKAVKASFVGEIDPNDPQAIIDFVQAEFDMTLKVTEAGPPGTAQPAVVEGEDRLKEVGAGSSQVQPDTRQARAGAALQAGDADALINAQIEQMMEEPIAAPTRTR